MVLFVKKQPPWAGLGVATPATEYCFVFCQCVSVTMIIIYY